MKGHRRAITEEGLFTGIVLTMLPLLIMGAMLAINRDYLLILFNDPVGVKMLQWSVVWLLIGFIFVKRIITFKEF